MLDTHCEKNLIINNRELKYSGVFRADELFAAINRAIEERGYEKREKKSEETVTEEGRETYIELRPYKEMSEYATLMLKIKIHLKNTTEAVEEVHGQKRKLQKGDVLIVFDAWSLTDYQSRWGMKPWVYFFKAIINKFVYTFPMESGFIGLLVGDTAYVFGHAKRLLNSYGEAEGRPPTEEEIKKAVEEEMGRK